MKSIRNIIFDFGGIFINLDLGRTQRAFAALTNDFEGAYQAHLQTHLFDRYERGELTEADFVGNLMQYAKADTRYEDMLAAWNAMLLDIPVHRLAFLKELRKDYRVFLLSNINHTHMTYIHAYLRTSLGVSDWDTGYFDTIYYSHQMGMRKPDARIYTHVLNSEHLVPSETLFIDDNEQNVAAANTVGIRAVLHNPQEDIVALLPYYLKSLI